MEFDHVAEEKQKTRFTAWLKLFLKNSPEYLSMQLAAKHRPGKPLAGCLWKNGAFNICYRVKYEDGLHVIVRFAALGKTILRREKVKQEVATMNFLRHKTSIPVPEVLGSGICWAGPYIVMPFIEGKPLSELLKDRSEEAEEERPVLNSQISDRSLRRAYREMATIILELSRHKFDTIGAIEEVDGSFVVAKRSLTFNMNELMTQANLPEDAFPSCTFKSAVDYFEALAMQHFSHLKLQQNDAIENPEDCRKKFTARCLYLGIVRDAFKGIQEPFRLYCDDFRPSNVLIDLERYCVSGAIDWEFTYAAPAEFTYMAPWWLLLQSPEDWESDLEQFLIRYTPRLRVFLDALRGCENELIEKEKSFSDSQRLSTRMEHSMETGLFWICLAARYSSMFDEIYWTFIDQRYHGTFTSLDDRIQLLNQEQQQEMNELASLKTPQSTESFHDRHSSIAFRGDSITSWVQPTAPHYSVV